MVRFNEELFKRTEQELLREDVDKLAQNINTALETARRDQPLTVGRMEDLLKRMKAEAEGSAQDAPEEESKKRTNPNAGRKPRTPRSFMSAAGYNSDQVKAVYDYLKAQFQAIELDPNIEDKKTDYLNILMAAYDAGVWGEGKSPSITQLAEDFKQINYSDYNTMYSKARNDHTSYRGETYRAVKKDLKSLLS